MLPLLPSQNLLRGLRNLRDESLYFEAPVETGGKSSKKTTVSSFGKRANERFTEVTEELEYVESSSSKTKRGRRGNQYLAEEENDHPTEIAECNQKFQEIVKGINNIMTGSGNQAATLRQHEEVLDVVKASTSKYWKVLLPSRPMQVTVTVRRESGSEPNVYGSTVHEKPSMRHCEYRAKEGVFVYEHVVKFDPDSEDAQDIDRTKVVPKCKELFVCVEGMRGEGQFRIHYALSKVKIVLTRAELAKRLQKIRRGWEARIEELAKEPSAREEFLEKVNEMQKEKVRSRKNMSSGKDFSSINKTEASTKFTPKGKFLQIRASVMKRYQMCDAAKERKAELEQKAADQKEWWLHKDEIRREERRREEEMALAVTQKNERQKHWLRQMCVVSVLEKTNRGFIVAVEHREQTLREFKSASSLQRFFFKSMTKKRRGRLYRNIIRLRLGVAAFARHCQLASCAVGQPALKWFLQTHIEHRETPSVGGLLAGFRRKVLLVQKFWKRLKRIRKARVEVMESAWKKVSVSVKEDLRQEEENKRLGRPVGYRKPKSPDPKSPSPATSPSPRRSPSPKEPAAEPECDQPQAPPGDPPAERRPGTKPKQGERRGSKGPEARENYAKQGPDHARFSMGRGAFVTQTREMEEEEDVEKEPDVPEFIKKQILMENVVEQQKSYDKRMKDWEIEKEEFEKQNDIAAFTGSLSSAQVAAMANPPKKPKPFSINENDFKQLVSQTFVDWQAGKFKHLEKNRERMLKKSFKTWLRALGYCMDSQRASPALAEKIPRAPSHDPG